MIDLLMNAVSGMLRDHKEQVIISKKLDAEIKLVQTLYKLNLMSTEEFKKARMTYLMAAHLERISK